MEWWEKDQRCKGPVNWGEVALLGGNLLTRKETVAPRNLETARRDLEMREDSKSISQLFSNQFLPTREQKEKLSMSALNKGGITNRLSRRGRSRI